MDPVSTVTLAGLHSLDIVRCLQTNPQDYTTGLVALTIIDIITVCKYKHRYCIMSIETKIENENAQH
jgi:hypothetical protein